MMRLTISALLGDVRLNPQSRFRNELLLCCSQALGSMKIKPHISPAWISPNQYQSPNFTLC